MIRRFAIALFLACACASAQVEIRPTPFAHVFDEGAKTLTPIFGLPGATVWGEPLALPFEPARISVRRGRALALDSTGSAVASPSLSVANPVWTRLPAAFEASELAINATGTRGVLASKKLGLAQFVRSLDGVAALSEPVAIGGAWTVLAVARDSDCVLVARAEEAGVAVDRMCAGRNPLRLLEPGVAEPGAMSWLPGDRQAAVADSASSRLLVMDTAAPASPAVIGTAADGLDGPVLVEAWSSGAIVVVNAAGPGMVLSSPARKPPFRSLSLPSLPRAIEMLPSGFVFGASRDDGSAFLADLEEEQVYVVPAR